jgi:hypothetical protein
MTLFLSFQALRARFPLAASKRLNAVWKFLRPYALDDFYAAGQAAQGGQGKEQ